MKRRDLVKNLKMQALSSKDTEAIMMFMPEVKKRRKFQGIKKLMND